MSNNNVNNGVVKALGRRVGKFFADTGVAKKDDEPGVPAVSDNMAMTDKVRAHCERKESPYFRKGEVARILKCTDKEARVLVKWMMGKKLLEHEKGTKWYRLFTMAELVMNGSGQRRAAQDAFGGNVFGAGGGIPGANIPPADAANARRAQKERLVQTALAAKHAGDPISDDKYNAIALAAGGAISRKSAMAQFGINTDEELMAMAQEQRRLGGTP